MEMGKKSAGLDACPKCGGAGWKPAPPWKKNGQLRPGLSRPCNFCKGAGVCGEGAR